MRIVLCVRVQPADVPEDVKSEMREKFGELDFVFVNPMTSDELYELAHNGDVAAVYLQEQPLPTRTLQEGTTPIAVRGPNGLARLVGVTAELEPF